MKNYMKYTQIFFLARSATVTHFARVSYDISTGTPSKTSMKESFLRISAGLPGSFCFCRKDSTGDIISGVLKTRTAEGCSLQGC